MARGNLSRMFLVNYKCNLGMFIVILFQPFAKIIWSEDGEGNVGGHFSTYLVIYKNIPYPHI